ncbi:MAG: NAD(P)/FAD-dependent oxidoreductase, partial [Candidatus Scatosoma sp.]
MKIERLTNVKLKIGESESVLYEKARRVLKGEPKYFKILKKSLDARDKNNIFYVYSVEFSLTAPKFKEEPLETLKKQDRPSAEKPVLIAGSGPAGLFCALRLLKRGITPVLIERGERVEEREKTLARFHRTGELNTESNVSFGEGGAGTFSDGKLNTGTHVKENDEVLREFTRFGAPEEILYLNKPHIGSDKLKSVVKNMREYLIQNGAKVFFGAKLTDLYVKDGVLQAAEIEFSEEQTATIRGAVKTESAKTETAANLCGRRGKYRQKTEVSALVLAIGHSARDTFETLRYRGVAMQKKDFAVGVRIEHLQNAVGFSQYGKEYT